jgi:hypothetical protein
MQSVSIHPGTTEVQADPTIFLMGRPTMNGSVAWLRTQTVEGKKTDVSELAGRWRTAHSKIVALGKTESMIADGISVTNLPESLAGLAKAVLEHPVTKQSFGLVPTSIKSVELGKLVVFQRNVNLTYASELQSALGSNATEEDVFHFALPIDGRYDPTTNVGQVGIGPNGVAYAIVFALERPPRVGADDPRPLAGLGVRHQRPCNAHRRARRRIRDELPLGDAHRLALDLEKWHASRLRVARQWVHARTDAR